MCGDYVAVGVGKGTSAGMVHIFKKWVFKSSRYMLHEPLSQAERAPTRLSHPHLTGFCSLPASPHADPLGLLLSTGTLPAQRCRRSTPSPPVPSPT